MREPLLIAFATIAAVPAPAAARGPNVLLVITDDQGYGDLACHGNPVIRTPHLDGLARDGVELARFYVSPVCAPTRASLLTGRYCYRTGVVDTYAGRALMCSEEITLAETLGAAGYRTGIFGKWHLGDNHPMRPMDQGFQESLVHRGGGIGQPADPPGNKYFDPVLLRDGKPVRTKGYCTDVFTGAAIEFIARDGDRPFFAYVAYNCPHDPLDEVPGAARKLYEGADLSPGRFPAKGNAFPTGKEDATARVYAMVTSIDENVGRLLAKLDALGIARDTIVVFLTDNGPQHPRYTAGLRGHKGSVFEGGIRVPCFVRWPARLAAGRKVDRIAAHIDLFPTLLEACGAKAPAGVALDGKSLLPLLEGAAAAWPDRTLFFQWHRGDEPEIHRAFAAVSQRHKLVRAEGAGAERPPAGAPYRLFDLEEDPFETVDLAGRLPETAEGLRRAYEAWFRDVSSTRGYAPPRIHLGASEEDPVTLTRQDWRGARSGWGPRDVGHWEVEVRRAGPYAVTLRFAAAGAGSRAVLALRGASRTRELEAGAAECTWTGVELTAGPGRVEAWIDRGGELAGVHYVEVRREGP